MDRYAVAGNPVEHSQSPFIHAMFARATGEPVRYERLLCPLDAFPASVQAFARSGGRGCNVTVPFKLEACAMAPRHSARAALAQAANFLRFDREGWFADNTDGAGLVRDIRDNAGVALAGARVLLIGAGGAAAGVTGPLIDEAPAQLTVANRSLDKAQRLLERHVEVAARRGVALQAVALDGAGEGYDVVINASASSLAGAAVPVDARVLRPGALALDMMYGAPAQGFVEWAAAHGAIGRDGLGMLVEQAAESFWVWRGIRPDTVDVLAALRQHLAAPP
jgi:shikimate dehydrogenase